MRVPSRNHRGFSGTHRITGNARTEIKERIRRATCATGKREREKKKRNLRASTYTCISGKLAPSNPTDYTARKKRERRERVLTCVCGCIIGISAPGRMKSGRRDQWLTRIVGAVRKIPYLHTKIRSLRYVLRLFFSRSPLTFSLSLFSVQSAGAR